MKSVILALLSTVVLGGVAHAQSQPLDPYAPYGPPAPPMAAPMAPMSPARVVPVGPPARPHQMGPLRAALLARFDLNHDGRLEPVERRRAIRALRRLERQMAREGRRTAQQQARVRRTVRRYDMNGDGVVGPDEMPPRAARQLRPLDRNGDGWVDDADF